VIPRRAEARAIPQPEQAQVIPRPKRIPAPMGPTARGPAQRSQEPAATRVSAARAWMTDPDRAGIQVRQPQGRGGGQPRGQLRGRPRLLRRRHRRDRPGGGRSEASCRAPATATTSGRTVCRSHRDRGDPGRNRAKLPGHGDLPRLRAPGGPTPDAAPPRDPNRRRPAESGLARARGGGWARNGPGAALADSGGALNGPTAAPSPRIPRSLAAARAAAGLGRLAAR
jgi:hypothetical protein